MLKQVDGSSYLKTWVKRPLHVPSLENKVCLVGALLLATGAVVAYTRKRSLPWK